MEELKEIRDLALKNAGGVIAQNKEEVIKAYRLVTGMAYSCRKEGILALEYAVGFLPKDTLLLSEITEMVRLVIDGMDARFISEMLTIKFLVNQYCGLEAFLYYLYARSILMIQEGASPYQIESFFNFAVPEKALFFDEQRNIQKEYNMKKLQELKTDLSDMERKRLSEVSGRLHSLTEREWKKLMGSSGFCGFEIILPFLDQEAQALTAVYMNPYRYQAIINSPRAVREKEILQAVKELEENIADVQEKDSRPCLLEDILKCSDEEVRHLISDVEQNELAVALKGVREEIIECFYRNMTIREKYCLQEDMEYIGPVRLCDVEAAQRSIMQKVKKNGFL